MLKLSIRIPNNPNKDAKLYFGATVTLLKSNNDKVTVTIDRGIEERDPLNGKISGFPSQPSPIY